MGPGCFEALDGDASAQRDAIENVVKYTQRLRSHVQGYLQTARASLTQRLIFTFHESSAVWLDSFRWHEKVLTSFEWHLRSMSCRKSPSAPPDKIYKHATQFDARLPQGRRKLAARAHVLCERFPTV